MICFKRNLEQDKGMLSCIMFVSKVTVAHYSDCSRVFALNEQ